MEQLHRNLMKSKVIITSQIQSYIETPSFKLYGFNYDVEFL